MDMPIRGQATDVREQGEPIHPRGLVCMALTFRYAVWIVADVAASVAFYERAFGLKLRHMPPSHGYAELETGATLLCFLSEAFLRDANLYGGQTIVPNRPSSAPGGSTIAFLSDDLERDWARAVAAGCSVMKAPEKKPPGQTLGYLRDINGIVVELTTAIPPA
jgi:lactoylglutathione lyase